MCVFPIFVVVLIRLAQYRHAKKYMYIKNKKNSRNDIYWAELFHLFLNAVLTYNILHIDTSNSHSKYTFYIYIKPLPFPLALPFTSPSLISFSFYIPFSLCPYNRISFSRSITLSSYSETYSIKINMTIQFVNCFTFLYSIHNINSSCLVSTPKLY